MDPMVWYVGGAALVVGWIIGVVMGRLTAPRPSNQQLAAAPVVKEDPGVPLRLLNIFQREGRLLDFLLEDIQAYDDAQVGAAVRDIHRGCRKTIDEHLTLERILTGEEGQSVMVPVGFDPAAIRLTGNVTGQPPFQGTLRHHGWRVKKINLPTTTGNESMIVAPAEVQLN